MIVVRALGILVLLLCSILLKAQEVKYIDLSVVSQRTELRHPPAPQCGTGVCGGYGVGSVADGAPETRDPHAIGVYLLHVSPAELTTSKPFEADFRVLNSGLAPIELPVSPHVADLQPKDESKAFSYFSLALVVSIEGDVRHVAFAIAELYGATDHEGTMLTLRPGEWITVRAKLTPRYSPDDTGTINLLGGFWLRRNAFVPHPGGSGVSVENLYPHVTPTPPISVRVVVQDDRPKH